MKQKGIYVVVLLLIILAALAGGCVGKDKTVFTVVNNQQPVSVDGLSIQMVAGNWNPYNEKAVLKITQGQDAIVLGFTDRNNEKTININDGSTVKIRMVYAYRVYDSNNTEMTAADFEIWR